MSRKFFNKLLCSNFRLYYRTHELNDILYLHFKGFRKIENLQTFTNLKVLYLEGNSIKKIEGLNHLKQLTSLYLHENCIEKIENLEGLDNLYNLNLSDNCIYKIENLSSLKNLSNLLLKRNRIGTNDLDDLSGLLELPEKLTVLDISDNRIEVTEIVKDYLTKIKNLRVLYMQGNECVRKIPHYRKTLINLLKELHYLDDKPVFDDERRFAEAFGRGGLEAEKKERALFKKEKEEYELNRLKDFQNLIDSWKKEKQVDHNCSQEDGDRNEEEGKEKAANHELASNDAMNDEQRQKEREEAKKKLLMKCKAKQQMQKKTDANVDKANNNVVDTDNNNNIDFNAVDSEPVKLNEQGKFLSISEETINEDDNTNKADNEKQMEKQEQKIEKPSVQKPTNEIFDDLEDDEAMPTLEQIKLKKQAEYIDYVIEKNNYEEENQIVSDFEKKEADDKLSLKKETEEEVDTTIQKTEKSEKNNSQENENLVDKNINGDIKGKENKASNFDELD